ncbi:carbohydrate sulfotransferase 11-like [Penaeus chinensis]|uniref:carbohydrate sulfotransferase 11-like n=1 Tax=Penaeus chinensis TaxID=139456 RepID=UPI001FB5E9A8|nr:carbohydrate sulfotransferase 11-like [Penaeus chinensis]
MTCKKSTVINLIFLSAVGYYSLWRFLPSYATHYHNPKPVYNPVITPHINLHSTAPARMSGKHLSWKGSVVEGVMASSGENASHWSKVMSTRQQRIKEVCSRHRNILRRFLNHNRLLFDTRHHLAYCRNAKAGTTSWLSILLTWAGMNVQGMDPEKIHEVAMEIFPNLGPKEAAAEMNAPAFTFTAVRHPFTRLVSAYKDKMVENYRMDVQENIISKYRVNNNVPSDLHTNVTQDQNELKQISKLTGFSWKNIVRLQKKYSFFQSLKNTDNISILYSDLSIPTFREFALYVSDQILKCSLLVNSACLESVDVHWQPFFNRCAPCDIKYKAIVKVETFSEDQQHIQQLMGLPDPPQFPEESTINKHASAGPSTNSLTKLYFSQMTPWERIRVYLAYYYDFQLFGYSPDDIV